MILNKTNNYPNTSTLLRRLLHNTIFAYFFFVEQGVPWLELLKNLDKANFGILGKDTLFGGTPQSQLCVRSLYWII